MVGKSKNCSLLVFAALVLSMAVPSFAGTGMFINRTELSPRQKAQLEGRLRARLLPGRYWYDRRSGLWGIEGHPNAGQLPPWLPVNFPLPADISAGGTGVFVNGREIHPAEYRYLQRVYGRVIPGRYWLNADGTAGFEGGPAAYNLFRAARSGGYGGGYHSDRGGSVIGGGGTVGFIGTDGTSVICEGGSCTYN